MSSLFEIVLKNISAFAHSKQGVEKEPFYKHCELTKKYYEQIISEFEINEIFEKLLKDIDEHLDISKITGFLKSFVIFHDIGKLTENFQRKLEGDNNSETHSDKGFFVITHELLRQKRSDAINSKEFFLLFSLLYAVYKHHSKLENVLEDISTFRFDRRQVKLSEISRYSGYSFDEEILSLMESAKFWERWNLYESKELFKQLTRNSFSLFILIKLFYSLLTSSDYYATFEYVEEKEFKHLTLTDDLKKEINNKFHEKEMLNDDFNFNVEINNNRKSLLDLDVSILGSEENDQKSKNLNKLRSKINIEAETSIEKFIDSGSDNNVFFLNVPTGGGKTNISMRLALKIIEKREKIKKMFYVFPFVNIIEQTYDSLKKFIGTENMARLDSRFIDTSMSDDYDREKLYSNHVSNLFFNKPILFLSHVKFFDLFFRNDKNSNYNFFQLANSVVIIDEIQAYNDTLWTEISYILNSFGRLMNTHFIVMSATLPKLEQLSHTGFNYLLNQNFTNEIFEHRLFKRVKITPLNTKKDKILSKVKAEKGKDKILVVFNKVKDSKDFFENIQNQKEFKEHKKHLLNSTILEEKRKEILSESKESNNKILLIATQSIEAGVDIDFDVGFRAYAPWDSIVQAAGRINRNNSKSVCDLYVFKDDDFKQVYRSDFKSTNTKDKEKEFYQKKDILESDLIYEFYADVIKKIKMDNRNPFIKNSEGNISDIKNLYLKIIDKEINLIDGNTVSLFIPKDNNAVTLWKEYEMLFKQNNSFENILKIKEFRKKLQKYSLNIFDAHTKKGKISKILSEEMKFGFYYCENWRSYYTEESGLDVMKFREKIGGREFQIL